MYLVARGARRQKAGAALAQGNNGGQRRQNGPLPAAAGVDPEGPTADQAVSANVVKGIGPTLQLSQSENEDSRDVGAPGGDADQPGRATCNPLVPGTADNPKGRPFYTACTSQAKSPWGTGGASPALGLGTSDEGCGPSTLGQLCG